MGLDRILKSTLKKIKPTKNEFQRLQKTTRELLKAINQCSPLVILENTLVCGSIAKGTFLAGTSDIDLFAQLKVEKPGKLSSYIHEVGECLKKKLNITPSYEYAENPYLSFDYQISGKAYRVNLVPIVYASSTERLHEALQISGMARTPFHTQFAQENLVGLEDEIRLLKFFAQQKIVYGIFGLTGWLCELLVLHFGSFVNVLKSADSIPDLVIDILNRDSLEELRIRFPNDRVVIVDPVDKDRNAAAGIQGIMGEFKLQRFITNAIKGLKTPEKLFQPLKISYNVEIIFRVLKDGMLESNLYTLLGGIIGKINSSLSPHGYNLKDAYIDLSKPRILLLFDRIKQTSRWIRGPPLTMKNAVDRFKQKHQDQLIRENEGYLWLKRPAKYTSIEKAIKRHEVILKEYLKIQSINTYAMIKINNLQEEIC